VWVCFCVGVCVGGGGCRCMQQNVWGENVMVVVCVCVCVSE